MALFAENPWDIVMAAAMHYLGVQDTRFIGQTFYDSVRARIIRETQATKEDLVLGLRIRQYHPPPVRNLCAFIALITAKWHILGVDRDKRYHFGNTEPSEPAVYFPAVGTAASRVITVGQPGDGNLGRQVPGVREGVDAPHQLSLDGEREQHS